MSTPFIEGLIKARKIIDKHGIEYLDRLIDDLEQIENATALPEVETR